MSSDDPPEVDFSVITTAIKCGGSMVEQIINGVHYGTSEVRSLLLDECDLIMECKVCRSLFRSLPNFVAHKRVYCLDAFQDPNEVGFPVGQGNRTDTTVVVVEPQAPEEPNDQANTINGMAVTEDNPNEGDITDSRAQGRPANTMDNTIKQMQDGTFQGTSEPFKFYTNVADKVEKEDMVRQTHCIRQEKIPGNPNAVRISVVDPAEVLEIETDTNVMEVRETPTEGKAVSAESKCPTEGSSDKPLIRSARLREKSCQASKTAENSTEGPTAKLKSLTSTRVHMNVRERAKTMFLYPVRKSVFDSKDCNWKSKKCLICNTKYSTNKSLQYHMRSHHGDTKRVYPCPKCSTKFMHMWGLTRHLMRTHSLSKQRVEKMRNRLKKLVYEQPVVEVVDIAGLSTSEEKDLVNGVNKPHKSPQSQTSPASEQSSPKQLSVTINPPHAEASSAGNNIQDSVIKNVSKSFLKPGGTNHLGIPTDKPKKEFSVKICSRTVSKAPQFASGLSIRRCQVCGKAFAKKVSLRAHCLSCKPVSTNKPSETSAESLRLSQRMMHRRRQMSPTKIERSPVVPSRESFDEGRKAGLRDIHSNIDGSQVRNEGLSVGNTSVSTYDSEAAAESVRLSQKVIHRRKSLSPPKIERCSAVPSRESSEEGRKAGLRDTRSSINSSPVKKEGENTPMSTFESSEAAAASVRLSRRLMHRRKSLSPPRIERSPVPSRESSEGEKAGLSDKCSSINNSPVRKEGSSVENTPMSTFDSSEASAVSVRVSRRLIHRKRSMSPPRTERTSAVPSRESSEEGRKTGLRSSINSSPLRKEGSSVENTSSQQSESSQPKRRSTLQRQPSAVQCENNGTQEQKGYQSESRRSTRSRAPSVEVASENSAPNTEQIDKDILVTRRRSLPRRQFSPDKTPEIGRDTKMPSSSPRRHSLRKQISPAISDSAERTNSKVHKAPNTPKMKSTSTQHTNPQESGDCETNDTMSDTSEDSRKTRSLSRRKLIAPKCVGTKMDIRGTSNRLSSENTSENVHKPKTPKAGTSKEAFEPELEAKDSATVISNDELLQLKLRTEAQIGKQITEVSEELGALNNTYGRADALQCVEEIWIGKSPGQPTERLKSNRIYVLNPKMNRKGRPFCQDSRRIDALVDENNLKCFHCGDAFASVSNIRRHAIRHLGWRRFRCKMCSYCSYHRSEMKSHLARVHASSVAHLTQSSLNFCMLDLSKEAARVRANKRQRTITIRRAANSSSSREQSSGSKTKPEDRRKPAVSKTNIVNPRRFNISTRKSPRVFDVRPFKTVDNMQTLLTRKGVYPKAKVTSTVTSATNSEPSDKDGNSDMSGGAGSRSATPETVKRSKTRSIDFKKTKHVENPWVDGFYKRLSGGTLGALRKEQGFHSFRNLGRSSSGSLSTVGGMATRTRKLKSTSISVPPDPVQRTDSNGKNQTSPSSKTSGKITNTDESPAK